MNDYLKHCFYIALQPPLTKRASYIRTAGYTFKESFDFNCEGIEKFHIEHLEEGICLVCPR